MKKNIFKFLKEYTTDVLEVDKLIVSSFLLCNGYEKINNNLIRSLVIKKTDFNYTMLQLFNSKFKIDTLEKVIEAFEYVISPEDKVVSGAVYTPENIRRFIVSDIFSKYDDIGGRTICDPACGCSGFLYTAIQEINKITGKSYVEIIQENIYGQDVKAYAVKRSKILLTLLSIINGEDSKKIKFNFFVGNALKNDWKVKVKGFEGFDIVVGNPPYVCSRNIDEESKSFLKQWEVSSTGHPDLYIPFFELGMTILKDDGNLGFITMNSFFKSLNGRALRRYFGEKNYVFSIIDFGGEQIFLANRTYTCICFLTKKRDSVIKYAHSKSLGLDNLKFLNVNYNLLEYKSGWSFKERDLVSKIEATGNPLSEVFKTSSGVATLKNDVYIFDVDFEDDNFYYMKCGLPVEKGVCREIINTNKLTKVKRIGALKRKIIFPYFHDDSESAVIIPEKKLKKIYPKAYAYLLTKKDVLAARDKGMGQYAEWFAYGRNQSLERYKYKLFFPHIAPETPHFIINKDRDLLFHNGLSLLGDDLNKLKIAQKIMGSRLFWFYIKNTSKPYGAGYMSLSKNYIKSFGIYDFSIKDQKWLFSQKDQSKIDGFIESKYGLSLG